MDNSFHNPDLPVESIASEDNEIDLLGPLANLQDPWKDSKVTRAKIYFEVRRRLRNQNIEISSLHPNIIPFLPTSHKNPDWWRRLLQETIQVSDDQLKCLFKLRESVQNSSAPSLSRQTLYVRSYKLKVEQLHYVMAKWEYQGRYYSESIEWAKMTESLDPSDFVFIRYIGMTTRTGIERCIEDKFRTFGLLRAFLRSLYNFFESPEELYICYEFVDGSLEDLVSAPSGDLKEIH